VAPPYFQIEIRPVYYLAIKWRKVNIPFAILLHTMHPLEA
jgi:hypothetical protein